MCVPESPFEGIQLCKTIAQPVSGCKVPPTSMPAAPPLPLHQAKIIYMQRVGTLSDHL